MNNDPYVGPRPFSEDDAGWFFGREVEIEAMVSRLQSYQVVVLYSQSGAGKSSLLSAGVGPKLAQRCKLLTAGRVSVASMGWPASSGNPFVLAILESWNSRAANLAEFFSETREKIRSDNVAARLGEPKRRPAIPMLVAIFDQFEDFFADELSLWTYRRPFLEDISKALATDPDLRVVLSMREESIAELEPFTKILAINPRAYLRLERLRSPAAEEAISGPVSRLGFSYEQNILDRLVNQLMKAEGDHSEEFIDPVQLQIVCKRIWERFSSTHGVRVVFDAKTKEPRIEHNQPGQEAPRLLTGVEIDVSQSVNEALTQYYDNVVQEAGRTYHPSKEGQVREWIDKALITDKGRRGAASAETLDEFGISSDALAKLVERYLVRAEKRGEARWYELVHERFVLPIRSSNKSWRAKYESDLNFLEELKRAGSETPLSRKQLKRFKRITRDPDFPYAIPREVTNRVRVTEDRRRLLRILFGAGCSALVVFAILAWLAWELEGAALQMELAFESEKLQATNPELSTMLAYAACEQTHITPFFNWKSRREAEGAMITSLYNSSSTKQNVWARSGGVAFSANHRFIARIAEATGRSGDTYAINVLESASLKSFGHEIIGSKMTRILAVSNDGRQVIVTDEGTPGIRIVSTERSGTVSDGTNYLKNVFAEQAAFNWNDVRFAVSGKDADKSGPTVWILDTGNQDVDDGGKKVFSLSALDQSGTNSHEDSSRPSIPVGVITHVEFAKTSGDLVLACGPLGAVIVSDTGVLRARFQESANSSNNRSFIIWASMDEAGDRLVTGSYGGSTSLWSVVSSSASPANENVATEGTPLGQIEGESGPVVMASFNADGSRVLIANDDGRIQLWNLVDDRIVRSFSGPKDGIVRAAFAYEGPTNEQGLDSAKADPTLEVVCAVATDGTIKVWDSLPEFPPIYLDSSRKYIRCNGKLRFAAVNSNGTILFMSSGEGQNSKLFSKSDRMGEQPSAGIEMGHAVDSSTKTETPVQSPMDVQLWTIQYEGDTVQTHKLNASEIQTLEFGPARDERTFAYIEQRPDGGTVYVAAIDKHAPLAVPNRTPLNPSVHPTAVAFALPSDRGSKNHVIEVGYSDGAVFEFTQDSEYASWVGGPKEILAPQTKPITALNCSPVAAQIAVGTADGTIMLLDGSQKSEPGVKLHKREITVLRFSPDGKSLLSGSADGAVCIWSIAESAAKPEQESIGLTSHWYHNGKVTSACFSEHSDILSVGEDGTVNILSHGSPNSDPLALRFPYGATAASFCDGDRRILFIDQEGWVRHVPRSDRWFEQLMRERRRGTGVRDSWILTPEQRAKYFRADYGGWDLFGWCEPIAELCHLVPCIPRELLTDSDTLTETKSR
jgi:WD40 repeat protein